MRERAKELNLVDAEVARRAGLSPRRYGFYVTGDRQPDFQTFITICRVLATTPNHLLGFEQSDETDQRTALNARLTAVCNMLTEPALQLVVEHAELVLDHAQSD